MSRIASLSLSLWLAGCTGIAGVMGAHVNAYEGKERPIGEVAVLVHQGGAMIARVDGRHVGDDLIAGYPSDVRVLPGEHTLRVDCRDSNIRLIPTEFRGRFEAGHFYQLYCHRQSGDLYAIDMKDLGTVDPRKTGHLQSTVNGYRVAGGPDRTTAGMY